MGILYLVAPGNISKAFTGIQLAATPDRVSQDFVKTVLNIPGSSGDQMTALLRRLGFSNSDGTPTELYRQYRNTESAGAAMANAIKSTYGELARRNEFFYRLVDEKLKNLIVEATGEASDAKIVGYMLLTLKNLIALANFDAPPVSIANLATSDRMPSESNSRDNKGEQQLNNFGSQVKMNLGYTINLNLPLTSDIEVFNAIFKSLREHLLNE